MTIGVFGYGGVSASETEGNEAGSGEEVTLLVIASSAKSYSPVPIGSTVVSTVAFALSQRGEM